MLTSKAISALTDCAIQAAIASGKDPMYAAELIYDALDVDHPNQKESILLEVHKNLWYRRDELKQWLITNPDRD